MDINAILNQIDTYFAQARLEDAERYMLQQVQAADAEGDKEAHITVANELIGFYRARKRHAESVKMTEETLDFIRANGLENTINHATTFLNGGTAYRFAGDSNKAMEYFMNCEKIYKASLPPTDYHYAGLYNNMSSALVDMKDYEKAGVCLNAAAYIVDAMPEHAEEAAVTHANLAGLYSQQGKWQEAADEADKACAKIANMPSLLLEYQQFKAMGDVFKSKIGK